MKAPRLRCGSNANRFSTWEMVKVPREEFVMVAVEFELEPATPPELAPELTLVEPAPGGAVSVPLNEGNPGVPEVMPTRVCPGAPIRLMPHAESFSRSNS